MSDQPQGPGWWQASDGQWYAPTPVPRQLPPPPRPPRAKTSLKSRTSDFYHRHPWQFGAILVLCLALAAGSVVATVRVRAANRAADATFVSDITKRTTSVASDSHALARLGHAECGALDAGAPFDAAVTALDAGATDPTFEATPGKAINRHDQRELLDYAVIDLCPKHIPELNIWLASQTP